MMFSSRRVSFQHVLDALLHSIKSSLRTVFERHFQGSEPALVAGCPVGPGLRERGCRPPGDGSFCESMADPRVGARSEALMMDDPNRLV